MATPTILLATASLIASGYNIFKLYKSVKRKRRRTLTVLSRLTQPIEENPKVTEYQLNQAVAEIERNLAKGAN